MFGGPDPTYLYLDASEHHFGDSVLSDPIPNIISSVTKEGSHGFIRYGHREDQQRLADAGYRQTNRQGTSCLIRSRLYILQCRFRDRRRHCLVGPAPGTVQYTRHRQGLNHPGHDELCEHHLRSDRQPHIWCTLQCLAQSLRQARAPDPSGRPHCHTGLLHDIRLHHLAGIVAWRLLLQVGSNCILASCIVILSD